MTAFRFPRERRLVRRSEYLAVYRRGQRAGARTLALVGLPNQQEHCRLGLTVSRKVGKAVVRNRAKRQLRELFRRNQQQLHPAMDLVVHAYPSINGAAWSEIERDFLRSFRRLTQRRGPAARR